MEDPMKQKKKLDLLWSSLATLGVFAFAGAMFLLYRYSSYRLFCLAGIFLLMLAAVNLILLVFGKEPKAPVIEKKKKPEENSEEEPPAKKEEARGKEALIEIGQDLKRAALFCAKYLAVFFAKIFRPLSLILLLGATVGSFVWFGAVAWAPSAAFTLAYWQLAVVGLMFVLAVVGDNLCKHYEAKDSRHAMLMRNACIYFKLAKILIILLAIPMTVSLLKLFDLQTYVTYALVALFYYVGVLMVVSLAVRAFRKELATEPGVVILLPFMGADAKELSVVSFLEENTGITLRSLWSIKYVRHILPYAIICAVLIFWISTGIVYVQSHQEAVVFRLGSMQEKTLEPGLHLTLPYPLDQSEIYDTETVNKMTIGYKATDDQDNVWTEAHGDTEYKLLLGSGKELVSINLRLEYRIADLKKYIRTSASPEKLLEAKAYEMVTDRTICSDLDTMLTTDRSSFSATFFEQLKEELKGLDTGLEVVSVVLESIHPPVEVADIYQRFIAAEIDAERYILEAQGQAASIKGMAETAKHDIVNAAKINYHDKVAKATVEISEFMASVNASDQYPDEYKYLKYLEAITEAYGNSRLVIVGNDVDTNRLYFGNFKPNS